MTGAGLDLQRIILAIAVVAAMLLLVPLLLRRFRLVPMKDVRHAEGLELVGQRSLDLRHRLVVVRYRQSDHLIVLGGSLPVVVGSQPVPGTMTACTTGVLP